MFGILSVILSIQVLPATGALEQIKAKPIRMRAAEVAAVPTEWLGMRIELCGVVQKRPTGRSMLIEQIQGREEAAVYVEEGMASTSTAKGVPCYQGIWRRVDGKTLEQILASPQAVTPHGYDPDYMLAKR